jgi:hypothetical protein
MRWNVVWCVTIGLVSTLACAPGAESGPGKDADGASSAEAPAPVILDHPFSAEQIRGEWADGLVIEIRRWTPTAEAFERWTVVRADADGVDIESVVIDRNGQPLGEPSTQTSTWVQLRDHASFPADRATREKASRETPLGTLDGWLYTVGDPAGGVVSEFFFAESLPGAPVFVHVRRDGEIIEIFEQIERSNR